MVLWTPLSKSPSTFNFWGSGKATIVTILRTLSTPTVLRTILRTLSTPTVLRIKFGLCPNTTLRCIHIYVYIQIYLALNVLELCLWGCDLDDSKAKSRCWLRLSGLPKALAVCGRRWKTFGRRCVFAEDVESILKNEIILTS